MTTLSKSEMIEHITKGGIPMSEEKLKAKLDQAAGSLKEKVGKVTGDKKLEAEGFVDKTIAKGKELADDAKETVEGVVDSMKDKLK